MVKDLVSPESVPRFIASPAETVLAFSFLNFLVWVSSNVNLHERLQNLIH